MLKIPLFISILICLFSAPKIQATQRQASSDVANDEIRFPDLVARSFSCTPNCNRHDANEQFEKSLDKQRIAELLSTAHNEIVIALYLYFDSDLILNKILDAASRGVTIKIFADWQNLDSIVPDSILALIKSQAFREGTIDERFNLLWNNPDYSKLNRTVLLSFVLNNSVNDNVVEFNGQVDHENAYSHMKFLLVDREYLVASSGNWSFTGLGYNYELFAYYRASNSPLYVEPFICAASKLFYRPETIDSCNSNEVFFLVPGKTAGFNLVYKTFHQAKKRIWVAGNQFGTELFLDTLEYAKKAGVDYKILTGSNICADHRRLERWHAAGLTIKCLPVNYCYYQQFHNKYFIVDDALYFGSLNLDYDGFFIFWDFLIRDDHFKGLVEEKYNALWQQASSFEETNCNDEPSCLEEHCVD